MPNRRHPHIVDFMDAIRPRVIGTCSIAVGDVELTPAASHLFALLLVFTLSPQERWSRRGLLELLFAGADERQASHRLRQLLYRLRGYGVVLQESSTGVLRLANPVDDPLATADELIAAAGVLPPATADPLGLYAPKFPAPFLDWVEQRRDALRAQLSARRLGQLREARERQDWSCSARLAAALHADDPASEDLVVSLAESYALLGRRDAALEAIDRYVGESGQPLGASPALKRLRTRIASTRLPRREGMLRARSECLATLTDHWERAAREPGGRVCVILGPAGMGKTRVGETFAASVRLSGGQVLSHRCDEQSRDVPLALFTHLVPDLRQRRGGIAADPALSRALDHLCAGGTPLASDRTAPEMRRDELRRALVDLVESVSAERPILILVDDAHLADEPSRAVLRALAEGTNAAHALVLLFCRPRRDGHSLASLSPRFTTYTLPPLDAADSRALLAEVATHRELREEEAAWAIGQAEGNPFYLHALALHPCLGVAPPVHVRSLAQSSYLAVSPEARTVLDACLLLDTLATPARVAHAAGVEASELLVSARELEEADLLRFDDGLLVGPHAIVRESLVELVPSTTRALLHHRIAGLLSDECVEPQRARVVAWTAVSSWLACGETAAAGALALQVARTVATLGEPEAGAVLLDRLPRSQLAVDTQREVLEEISEMAEAGMRPDLAARALSDRLELALTAKESRDVVADIRIRTVACDVVRNARYDQATLEDISEDRSLSASSRVESYRWRLAIADLHFRHDFAKDAFAQLQQLTILPENELAYLRAMLIFHTTFGDRDLALQLARRLLSYVPRITKDRAAIGIRSNVSVALLRLGMYEECSNTSLEDFTNALRFGQPRIAEHAGTLAISALLDLGAFERAEEIQALLDKAHQRYVGTSQRVAAYYSGAIYLALIRGDVPEARRLIEEVQITHSGLIPPRMRLATATFKLMAAHIEGSVVRCNETATELALLFEVGQHLGGQDRAAEALRHWKLAIGDESGAATLLSTYRAKRREFGEPCLNFLSSIGVYASNAH